MTFLSWTLATDELSYDLHVRRYVTSGTTIYTEEPEISVPYLTGGDTTTWLPIGPAASVRWSIVASSDWGSRQLAPYTDIPAAVAAVGAFTTGSTATTIKTSTALPPRAYSNGQYALYVPSAGGWGDQWCRITGHTGLASGTNDIVVESPGFAGAVPTTGQFYIIPLAAVGNRPNFHVLMSNQNVLPPVDGGVVVASPTANYNVFRDAGSPTFQPLPGLLPWSATGEVLVPHSYIAFAIDGPVFDASTQTGLLATISVTIQNRGSK